MSTIPKTLENRKNKKWQIYYFPRHTYKTTGFKRADIHECNYQSNLKL